VPIHRNAHQARDRRRSLRDVHSSRNRGQLGPRLRGIELQLDTLRTEVNLATVATERRPRSAPPQFTDIAPAIAKAA
jgi:hypothetical protein